MKSAHLQIGSNDCTMSESMHPFLRTCMQNYVHRDRLTPIYPPNLVSGGIKTVLTVGLKTLYMYPPELVAYGVIIVKFTKILSLGLQ